jgi:hypothetical protein
MRPIGATAPPGWIAYRGRVGHIHHAAILRLAVDMSHVVHRMSTDCLLKVPGYNTGAVAPCPGSAAVHWELGV